jgi:hypothetical protein
MWMVNLNTDTRSRGSVKRRRLRVLLRAPLRWLTQKQPVANSRKVDNTSSSQFRRISFSTQSSVFAGYEPKYHVLLTHLWSLFIDKVGLCC